MIQETPFVIVLTGLLLLFSSYCELRLASDRLLLHTRLTSQIIKYMYKDENGWDAKMIRQGTNIKKGRVNEV